MMGNKSVPKLVCPKCEGDEFYKGPEGGATMNVKCANCGHRMNVAFTGHGFLIINEDLGE